MIKPMLIILIVLLTGAFGFSQERLVNKRLDEVLALVRAKKSFSIDESILYKQQNHTVVIQKLESWIIDTMADVRLYAGKIINKTSLVSMDRATRQKSVNFLLKLSGDADTRVANEASGYLKNYTYLDFDQEAQKTIRANIIKKTFGYVNLLKVAGFLNIPDISGPIKEKIASGTLSRKEKWAAYLALARLGDATSVDFCLDEVKKFGLKNNVVYDILPDLIYTRQRKCFDYLVGIIQNNEPLCESANPEAPGKILCGYRVMEYLAPVIENFPLKTGISGDIVTKDYKQALKETRTWFKSHPDYKIVTDKL